MRGAPQRTTSHRITTQPSTATFSAGSDMVNLRGHSSALASSKSDRKKEEEASMDQQRQQQQQQQQQHPLNAVASKRMVDETKQLYLGLLRKQLDERQLAKPPFKFILDLLLNLAGETKMLKDLTGPIEMEAKRRAKIGWDRRAKVELAQQLIDFVASNKQQVSRCSASKLAAGLEPNKTNELLQALARVLRQRQVSADQGKGDAREADRVERPRTFTKRPIVPEQVGLPHSSTAAQGRPQETHSVSNQRTPAAEEPKPVQRQAAPERILSATGSNLKEDVEQARVRLKLLRSVMADVERLNNSLDDTLTLLISKREASNNARQSAGA